MDAAGKDFTIKHVMSGVNPQGVQVVSFKQPSSEETYHTYLWRISNALRVNRECDNVLRSGHVATGTDREAIMEHSGLVSDDFGYVGTIVPIRDGVMAALRVE